MADTRRGEGSTKQIDERVETDNEKSTENEETLDENEVWWRDRFDLFERHGYRLRPRFRPGWLPSWKTSGKNALGCEDSVNLHRKLIMDATRISDDIVVVMKRVRADTEEVTITRMLSTPERLKDDRNHTVPILDYFVDEKDPKQAFIVMPLLRRFNDSPFTAVNEVLDFVRQVLDGLHYLHELGVAHRDCYDGNILMDATGLYPRGFHTDWPEKTPDNSQKAKHLRRSDLKMPVRYYFIDFGISTWFREGDSAVEGESKSQAALRKNRMVKGTHGLLETVPELSDEDPYDPFMVDIYILGILLWKTFVVKYANLGFLAPLTNQMSHPEPKERPNAQQAVELFDKILREQKQSPISIRWRLKERREKRIPGLIADLQSALWEVKYQIGQIPSMLLAPIRREKTE